LSLIAKFGTGQLPGAASLPGISFEAVFVRVHPWINSAFSPANFLFSNPLVAMIAA